MAPESFINGADDFVFTISDNDENLEDLDAAFVNRGTKRKRQPPSQQSKPRKTAKLKGGVDQVSEDEVDGSIASDFEFEVDGAEPLGDFDGWDLSEKVGASAPKKGVDIDELIERQRRGSGHEATRESNGLGEEDDAVEAEGDDAEVEEEGEEDETLAEDGFGMGFTGEEKDDDENDDADASSGMDDGEDEESLADPTPHPDDQMNNSEDPETDDDENADERAKEADFFAPVEKPPPKNTKSKSSGSFQTMSLSRPILRGLASVGFDTPTPIQLKTIPIALLGKDLVGGAVTGSGKTAAFIIPILERLLYRPKKIRTSRVAILMPTRELAVQCLNVAQKLASFTDITICQLVGGFSLREQEIVLRQRPDIIIATPGRFIDHMRNSPNFTVDTLEILVLDEADRMLDDGFADELNEILTTIPRSRQTMLFSATMTSRVDSLIRLGLNRPVRLMVDPQRQTVGTLTQEFVRLRPGREGKRIGYLLHLCTRTFFHTRTIIFFRQKSVAHRTRIIFGLLNLKAAELHGSMSQEQRINAVTSFREGKVNFLLATDVASRGLDIKDVSAVINYEMPQSHEIYIHRVGRTARAGRSGRACTIVAEGDRKIMRAIVRGTKPSSSSTEQPLPPSSKIASRTIDPSDADTSFEKIRSLDPQIETILSMEKSEKLLSETERDLRRGENLIQHSAEIMARPKRTWFESEKEKKLAKEKGGRQLNYEKGKGEKGNGMMSASLEKKVERIKRGKEGGRLSGKDRKRLDGLRERGGGAREWKKGKGEGKKEGNRRAGKGIGRERGKGRKVRR